MSRRHALEILVWLTWDPVSQLCIQSCWLGNSSAQSSALTLHHRQGAVVPKPLVHIGYLFCKLFNILSH